MKLHLKLMLLATTIAVMLFGGTACNKPSDNKEPIAPTVVLGNYSYAEENYDITYAVFLESDSHYEFLLSPQNEGEKIHTLIQMAFRKGWCDGTTYNFEEIYHNDDYTLVYNDQNHYYSQYFKTTGTFSISRNEKTDLFQIKIDGHLVDGTPLKVSFSAVIKPSN